MEGKILSMIFLVVVASTHATSQQDEKRDETKCCCTTYEISICLSEVNRNVDGDLNETYRQAIAMVEKSNKEDLDSLKDAHRKWLDYRDAECKAEYGLWGGGSGGPNARAMCLIRLTKERTADLKSTYLER
jgi:uncharacterized protein YecT (DUF1311 family)